MKVSEAATGLKSLRVQAGMSVREVADALGRPHSTYASYEDKFKKALLPMDLVNALVPIFTARGVEKSAVLKLGGAYDSSAGKATPVAQKPPSLSDESLPNGTINLPAMPRDVPILGSGACGEEGLFELNGQVLDHAKRPPRLIGVKDAYALYVHGESMAHWREHGELVYVHPHMPVKINDYVVVELNAEGADHMPMAYIKRLVRRNDKEIRLLQFNPREEKIISMRKVKHIHRIIDWSELMGI